MRCRDARKILEQEVEGVDPPGNRDAIRAHLASCTACSQFAKELRLTWDLLDTLPEIPVSETFNRNVLARVRQADMDHDNSWTLGRVLGWQWMTLAASVLVLAIVLV